MNEAYNITLKIYIEMEYVAQIHIFFISPFYANFLVDVIKLMVLHLIALHVNLCLRIKLISSLIVLDFRCTRGETDR